MFITKAEYNKETRKIPLPNQILLNTTDPNETVALTNKQFFTRISTSERAAVYEKALEKIRMAGFDALGDVQPSVLGSVESTKRESVKTVKRRPKAYRTGRSSCSYTEKIRGLIDYQMSLIREQVKRMGREDGEVQSDDSEEDFSRQLKDKKIGRSHSKPYKSRENRYQKSTSQQTPCDIEKSKNYLNNKKQKR